jgi:hypothetical protein
MAGAAFADQVALDGDTAKNGNDIGFAKDNPSFQACDARWTALNNNTVAGEVVVTFNGNTHYNIGADVTLTLDPSAVADAEGIVATGGSAEVPAGYNANGDTFTIAFTTRVPATAADGQYDVDFTVSGPGTDNKGAVDPYEYTSTFKINIDCEDDTPPPSNQAPSVTAAWDPDSIGCRVASTLKVYFTDDDDSTSWTAAIDWNYDGTFDDGNAESIGAVTPGNGTDPSFTATHAYNAPGTYTAGAQVTDNQGAVGFASDALTVNQTYSATFLQPLDGSSPSKLIANTMKKGRVVPIKVTIKDDCTLAMVNDPSTAVGVKVTTATFTPTSTDQVETFSDAGQSAGEEAFFRWSADSTIAGGGFWIFNLDSNGLQIGTCYKVQPEIGGIATSNFALLKPTK